MNSVVIPCFVRADYLSICLEYITKADNWQNYAYVFACDFGTSAETLRVIDKFKFKNKFKVFSKHNRFGAGKQSHNVMNGLLSELHKDSELVFYIEDDVFIGKDFFTFHEDIHKKANPFVSIVSKNMNSRGKEDIKDDKNAYYVKISNEYQGIGSCFNKQMLFKYLRPHFVPAYFSSITRYVKQQFPGSVLDNNYVEQDGLIRRIIEKNHLSVCFSHIPRCFHAGFYGYHRTPKINMNSMTFENRRLFIKKFAFNPDELKKISENQFFVSDSFPVNLYTDHTDCYELPC